MKIKSYTIALVGCLIAVFVDQFTKWLAIEHLKDQPSISIIEGVFQLLYLENSGAAFGIMQGQQSILIVVTFIILALIILVYSKIPHTKRFYPMRICAVLLVAGAVGNLIDRIRWGFVVDFFYFYLIDFPIFNVADSYVVIACILFAILVIFYYKDHELEAFRFKNKKD